jgi:hypothetical protein
MKNPEQTEEKKSGLGNRMNSFYFELISEDGSVEAFGSDDELDLQDQE